MRVRRERHVALSSRTWSDNALLGRRAQSAAGLGAHGRASTGSAPCSALMARVKQVALLLRNGTNGLARGGTAP